MKKNVVIAGLLALTGIVNAQPFNPPGSTPGTSVFRKGLTGFGMNVPPLSHMVEIETTIPDDGLSITQLGNGASLIKLNNTGPGGFNWSLNSLNNTSNPSGGHFVINNLSSTLTTTPFMIDGITGNVGINSLSPTAKLEVVENSGARAGLFDVTASNFSTFTGVKGNATAYQYTANAIGIEGTAQNTWNTIGVGAGNIYGVKGSVFGGGNNYGGHFAATGTVGINYGVYASVVNSGTNTADWAGWFQGNVNINGLAYCTNSVWSSDRRFKKNIQPLDDVTEKLLKLKGYSYEYKTEEFKAKNFVSGKQIGFIAQELGELFPELVTKGTDGYNYVNYIGMIPILLEAIKSQQIQIDELKNKEQNSNSIIQNETSSTGFSMGQNEPNPFTGETVIPYTLSQQINKAYLAVYDLSGKQLATFPLNERGSSSLKLSSENLSAGIYIYSIIADGKIMDSKKMVVTEK